MKINKRFHLIFMTCFCLVSSFCVVAENTPKLRLLSKSSASNDKALSKTGEQSDIQFKVVALFKDSAMIEFNGKRKFYRTGQSLSPQVKLISANTQSAIFSVDGEKVELSLDKNMAYGLPKVEPERQKTKSENENLSNSESSNASEQEKTVLEALAEQILSRTNSKAAQQEKLPQGVVKYYATILRDLSGMFRTMGYINGQAIELLVDTGATNVAIDGQIATAMGINYRMTGLKVPVQTAAGERIGWLVNLKSVRVGTLELKNVQGIVIEGAGNVGLLGMSFLNRVKMENSGQIMRLYKKY